MPEWEICNHNGYVVRQSRIAVVHGVNRVTYLVDDRVVAQPPVRFDGHHTPLSSVSSRFLSPRLPVVFFPRADFCSQGRPSDSSHSVDYSESILQRFILIDDFLFSARFPDQLVTPISPSFPLAHLPYFGPKPIFCRPLSFQAKRPWSHASFSPFWGPSPPPSRIHIFRLSC